MKDAGIHCAWCGVPLKAGDSVALRGFPNLPGAPMVGWHTSFGHDGFEACSKLDPLFKTLNVPDESKGIEIIRGALADISQSGVDRVDAEPEWWDYMLERRIFFNSFS